MDVAVLVYEAYTTKLQCGTHFSITVTVHCLQWLYLRNNSLWMYFVAFWGVGGCDQERIPMLFFKTLVNVFGRNSIHNIFFWNLSVLFVGSLIQMFQELLCVLQCLKIKFILCHCKLSLLLPVKHSALLNSSTFLISL